MFRAEHRKTGEVEIFFAGEHAANEFLRIIPSVPLPRFNPLHEDGPGEDGQPGPPGDPGQPRERIERTPLNRELFQAVHIFVCWIPGIPKAPLSGLIMDINKRPLDSQNEKLVKSLNTMIGKYQRTLRQMIQDLIGRGNHIRNFTFPLICDVIRELNLPNNIDL